MPATIAPRRPFSARRALLRWYRANGRHTLDWRLTRDPYAVLVSEVMLQQTQVERVVPYYRRWLERWPSVASLAAASPAEVIREWSGLGYNRRAIALHRAVREVDGRRGRFPRDPAHLRALPGVGSYTAAAIACFAFGRRVAIVEANIARVLSRAFLGCERPRPAAHLGELAASLLPARNARDHNLALMDLGATVCRPRNPDCGTCPLRRHCRWLAAGRPSSPTSGTPVPRFESTARFARGRIVAALRDSASPLALAELAHRLPAAHRTRLPEYLAALEREGLALNTARGWSLPT